jgi:putative SOS response-associated peptidase YedK
MCGRYDLSDLNGIAERYRVDLGGIELWPNHNVKPSQIAPVIVYDQEARRNKLVLMRWGIKPHWAKDTLINAVAETAATTKFWGPLVRKHQLCLVAANAFYEWDDNTHTPFAFSVKDTPLISLGGLYGVEKGEDGQEVSWYVIMTTKANKTVGRVHRKKNRMAFILDQQTEGLYLTEPDTEGLLTTLATPYPDELMQTQEVAHL